MNASELFEACGRNETPLEVLDVRGAAADNAAATIDENGGAFVQGQFTSEFFSYWYASVQGILCNSECPEIARDWFAERGVKY